MYMYIGIEDLVANAIIELVEKSQRREVLFSEVNRYGATVIQILSENDKKAVLILSKERTNAFLHDYSHFFELFSNGIEEGIRLKEGIPIFIDCQLHRLDVLIKKLLPLHGGHLKPCRPERFIQHGLDI